jgi:uncharacterized protein (DUF927 family)
MKVRQWRATANALEGAARISSDSILVLDELGQIDAAQAAASIYMLANSAGKQRARVDGSPREIARWSVLYLSTGEVDLAAKLAEIKQSGTVGLDVRLVSIPADAGAGLGAFETLHGFDGGAGIADHLRRATQRTFGAPARAWLDLLVELRSSDEDALRLHIEESRKAFVSSLVPRDAGGQVMSVANRFALVAAAGELAIMAGILPWPSGTADLAATTCFRDWLAVRGHVRAGETERMLAALRAFIVANRHRRFTSGFVDEAPVAGSAERIGWTRRNPQTEVHDFLFQSDLWPEVFKGTNIDPNAALKKLKDLNFLRASHEKDGRLTRKERLGGNGGQVRVYWIYGDVLEDSGADGR